MKEQRLKYSLVLCLASQTIISHQVFINNQFIGHDVLSHNRIFNIFDDFKDWETKAEDRSDSTLEQSIEKEEPIRDVNQGDASMTDTFRPVSTITHTEIDAHPESTNITPTDGIVPGIAVTTDPKFVRPTSDFKDIDESGVGNDDVTHIPSTTTVRQFDTMKLTREVIDKRWSSKQEKPAVDDNDTKRDFTVESGDRRMDKRLSATKQKTTNSIRRKLQNTLKRLSNSNRRGTHKRYTILNRNRETVNLKVRGKKLYEESSLTDEEDTLRVNLDNALFHDNEPALNYRKAGDFGLMKDSSYTDEEAVLKMKIYKTFGFQNNFARTLKDNKIHYQSL